MSLWLSLKKNKIHADIYYQGKRICTIAVNEGNRSNTALISLITKDSEENETGDDIKFKIVKTTDSIEKFEENKDFGNKEIYNT